MSVTKAKIVIERVSVRMYGKVCPICGKQFTTKRHNRIYCGDKCAREGAYRRRAFGWYPGKDKPEERK